MSVLLILLMLHVQTDSVLVDARDAENVLVTKDDFEHALTYDVKPVSDLREHITLVVALGYVADLTEQCSCV